MFIYAFTHERDNYLYPVSIAFALSSPAIHAAFSRHSWIVASYAAAFFLLSLSSILRFQIVEALKGGEVLNAATRHGILKLKKELAYIFLGFLSISTLLAMTLPQLFPFLGLSAAFLGIALVASRKTAFYMSLASLLLFASTMVMI